MYESSQTVSSCLKLEDIFSDIRFQPEIAAENLSRSQLQVQERIFDFTLAYIRNLALQAATGGYINGNMDIANQSREIQETLLTFQTQP